MATIASTIVNVHNASHTEKDKEPIVTTYKNFMPIWDAEQREKLIAQATKAQAMEEMKEALMAFARVHNAAEEMKGKERKRKPTLKIKK